ncbi:MAG: DUF234 domain-containing protein, partial [Elusimicrobiota bacterium]
NNGCSHARIIEEYAKLQADSHATQIGGHLHVLESKFQIIERRHPVFNSKGMSRKARYHIADNFLSAWLGAIERQVNASRVRPMDTCVRTCSERLSTIEGKAFEKLVRLLLEELSRKGDPGFQITAHVSGYWNRPEDAARNIELDLLLINEEEKTLRIGTCKRSPDQLLADWPVFRSHQAAFLRTKEGRRFSGFSIIPCAFAPRIPGSLKARLQGMGCSAFGLDELLERT